MSTDADDLAPGTLLVAAPMMEDPNFRRSVVLICEHKPDRGSFGLVLNQPTDVQLSDVLEDAYFAYDPQLHIGGPVQRDTLHFVHRCPSVPEGIDLPGDVTWGGDFDAVRTLVRDGEVTSDDIRFFVGYAGWSPGQLVMELDEKAWIVAPEASGLLFSAEADELWRSVLRRLGGEYALLSTFPDDPRMN